MRDPDMMKYNLIQESVRVFSILTVAIAVSLVGSQLSHAQTAGPGSIYIGGGLGFSSINNATSGTAFEDFDESRTVFSVTPTVGYYLSEEIIAGIGFGFESMSFEEEVDDIEGTQSVFNIAPFVRYSEVVTDNLRAFAEFQFVYGSGEGEEDTPGGNTIESELTRIDAGIRPGLTYHFNDAWAIEPTFGFLGYRSETTTDQQEIPDEGFVQVESEFSEFGLDLDLSTLQLGIAYHF